MDRRVLEEDRWMAVCLLNLIRFTGNIITYYYISQTQNYIHILSGLVVNFMVELLVAGLDLGNFFYSIYKGKPIRTVLESVVIFCGLD